MNNIFVFNIGPASNFQELKKKLQNKYNLVIGPSKSDMEILNKIPYFKKAIDEKIWSFASDVWRFYKLSEEKGLYIDTTVEIGANFDAFYNNVSRYKTWIFKINDKFLNVPIIYGDHSDFFRECFEYYKDFKYEDDIRKHFAGPRVANFIALKNGYKGEGFDSEDFKEIHIGTVLEVRNKNEIYKVGGGSWFIGNKKSNKRKAKKGWDRFEKDFKRNKAQDPKDKGWQEIIHQIEK